MDLNTNVRTPAVVEVFSNQKALGQSYVTSFLHVFGMVLQAADELCDGMTLVADLIDGVEQREPGGRSGLPVSVTCSVGCVVQGLDLLVG